MEQHRRFWEGEGPSLLLLSPEIGSIHNTQDYRRNFNDPEAMWQSEMQRAHLLRDWPTDGIPTIRPNLGVIFIPSVAGQSYKVHDDQMPWPGDPLDLDVIRASRNADLEKAELLLHAQAFYRFHQKQGINDVAPYHPDTQGVFDIAHLLYGHDIFAALAGEASERSLITEVMEAALDLYLRVTLRIKEFLQEPLGSMIHGHGAAQGVYFPRCGVRTSEDTAILLSPAMIQRHVMPYIERCLAPFDGGFVHFCGRHPALFELVVRCPLVRAIDLGDPGQYDLSWLLQLCASTGTVLHSRLPAIGHEKGMDYIRRLAKLVTESGARVILRAMVAPANRNEATEMLAAWHELTEPVVKPKGK